LPQNARVMSVVQSNADYLKIFREEPPQPAPVQLKDLPSLAELFKAFRQATGWSLQYAAGPEPCQPTDLTWSAPVNPGVGATPGHLRIDPVGSRRRAPARQVDLKAVRKLASALAGVVGELLRTQHALWQREAELAAGVPLVPHRNEQQHLASRLESVLKGGAEAVRCQAAALFLLDEATTSLKLRSGWGLPRARLADPPRPLQGALADLEAMLGHAVVLNDTHLLAQWNPPEDFPSAVCVPVATSTTILGTLWIFSSRKRDFDDHETNIIEVTAGRVAAELEREMLMREGVDGAQLKRQIAAAERLQRNQLPTIAPLLDDWDLAGWNSQAGPVGGDFYDWFALPDSLLVAAVGDVAGQSVEAALSASALKAALRSHGQYHRDAAELLAQVNLTLWTGSAGDQSAGLFCGLVETGTGRVRYGLAGNPAVVLLRPEGWKSLSQPAPSLGESPESLYRQQECGLEPGEAMVIFTAGVRDARDQHGKALGEVGLAEALKTRLELPAKELVAIARDRLEAHAPAGKRQDRTVLVIKRANP
jgi:sigma-B regulation protein RsbU (phosphoserine phosphatase)